MNAAEPKGGSFPARFSLSNKVALVTGAAGHLGAAIALSLAEAGAKVYLCGLRSENVDRLCGNLKNRGLSAVAAPFDVTDQDAVSKFIDTLTEADQRLDILVNNAHAGTGGTIENAPIEEFASSYDIAVVSAFRLVRAALPHLRLAAQSAGGASVINIASMYGTISPDPRLYADYPGRQNPPFYGAAKAGLIQLSRYLACHLASDGIRVNAVSPGPFSPPRVQEELPEFVRRLEERVPLGRLGRPDELAGVVVFLASDASSYVTGINLPVDGGWAAW
jgi:NAD(P)-dependent dehydrogenase (short-subunit alcohol dehydrogenase family)